MPPHNTKSPHLSTSLTIAGVLQQFDALFIPGGYSPDHLRADRQAVVDKSLVTSRQPSDIPAFIEESLKLLEKVPVGSR